MALANIEAWNEGKQTGGTSCGTACGASDNSESKPAACGASDK